MTTPPRRPRPAARWRIQAPGVPRSRTRGRRRSTDNAAAWEPEHDEGQGSASLVRAYTWTGGRTRSDHHFEVETLVTTTELGHRSTAVVQSDHRPVIELCQEPRSVAEVAAMLSVPLGVVKVLLGDMAERGLIAVHETAVTQDGTPDGALMERVLVGLRRI